MIRVLLVDDHQMVRQGVAAMLGGMEDVQIVGEAATGSEALRLALELEPDVVVMDVALPEVDGLQATRMLTEAQPRVSVLILSMHDDASTVDQALRAGAKGYVLKGQSVQTLCDAIRVVSAGRSYLSPEVADFVIQGYLNRDASEVDPLTEREREVLSLIATGLTSSEVADRLGLKTKTVQNHRTNLMEKLGIHTTAGLVRYALRNGLTR